jgi:membrane protein
VSLVERLRLQASLTGRAALQGLRGFYRGDGLTYASSIAYFALLSLFPFLLLALALLGSAIAGDADRTAAVAFIHRYFPHQFQFVTEQIDAFRGARWSLGIAGTVLMTWAALGVFDAITTAVNYAWGVPRQHGFLRHKLLSFVMLLAAGTGLLVALLLVSAYGVIRSTWFASLVASQLPLVTGHPLLQWASGIASWWAATALMILVVSLIFCFVPNTVVSVRDVWIGAIITGLLWHGAMAALSAYIEDLGHFSVHGSIAAVVAFLIWVYVQAVILLYGAGFTAAYARLRATTAARRGSSGSAGRAAS